MRWALSTKPFKTVQAVYIQAKKKKDVSKPGHFG